MSRRRAQRDPDPRQMSFDDFFVVPAADEGRPGSIAGFDQELRAALSNSLKDSPSSRYEVAAQMSELLGDDVSKNMLDAYTAESRDTHQISVVRLVALILATKDYELLAMVAEKVGCRLLVGDEARLAARGYVREQIRLWQKRERELDAMEPVQARRGGRA